MANANDNEISNSGKATAGSRRRAGSPPESTLEHPTESESGDMLDGETDITINEDLSAVDTSDTDASMPTVRGSADAEVAGLGKPDNDDAGDWPGRGEQLGVNWSAGSTRQTGALAIVVARKTAAVVMLLLISILLAVVGTVALLMAANWLWTFIWGSVRA